MIRREQVESILKINGVPESAADEEIRSVLLSARYNKDEVDTAIMVLRENVTTNKTRVDGLHKVFRTNETLSPEEISQLLGIDVTLEERVVPQSRVRKMSVFQIIIVWMLATSIAFAGIIFYMYLHQVGFFHPDTNERII